MTEKRIHEVDGILEEDNKLPRWWLATFFIAVVFAYGYWEWFHVLAVGLSPREELALVQKDLEARRAKAAGAAGAQIDEQALLAAASGAAATNGQQLFMTNCAACHGNAGEGKIGPNLTDGYWIHGGAPVAIHTSISNGYPLKGMPAWMPVLGADKIKDVTAYVLTLRGKNLPGKPPEGPIQGAREATDAEPGAAKMAAAAQ